MLQVQHLQWLPLLQDRVRAELREASLTPDAQQPPTKQLEYAGQAECGLTA